MTASGMTETEYAAHRRRLTAAFALRVLAAGIIIYVWDELEGLEKIVAIAAAVVVVPGLSTIKRMFVSYERYLREGVKTP